MPEQINVIRMLAHIFRVQENTNIKYSGDNWRQFPSWKWRSAADREFSEFLDEIQDKWVWWKEVPATNVEKARLELVDAVSFAVSVLLHDQFETSQEVDGFINSLIESGEVLDEFMDPKVTLEGDQLYEAALQEFNLYWHEIICDRVDFEEALGAVANFIVCCTTILGITIDDFMSDHAKKHEIYNQRIQGDYRKPSLQVITGTKKNVYH